MLFVPQWLYRSVPPATDHDDDDAEPETIAAKLQHYHPHAQRPPSSRIDPHLEQREFQGRTLVDIFRCGVFIATKASEVASDLVRHKLVGARKPSWGIEMTILSAFMRNIGNNTSLADIPMLRAFMALSGYGPLPSDAIVTPVTFRARTRNLRGFLADADAKEDGSRMLSAEWVIGKRLWTRLQDEWRRTNLDANGKRPRHKHERVILFLHGGAYYVSSSAAHRPLTIPLSKYTDARIFALDYRLAPETRFPGQLHDAALAYLRLVEDLRIPPENLIVCGDSAGGGLALALLLYLRDNKYPLPAAAILMSPWVDMTMSCDSWDSNAEFDLVPIPLAGDHLNPILCFLGPEGMAKHLTHPYASPLFGAMEGLPPLLIQSGDAEVLRDESMLLAHKATLAGVNVRHEIYEDQVHVFQALSFLEAATKAMMSCRDFVNIHLSRREGAKEMAKETEATLAREIDSQAARVVNGDGTVVDDKRPSDLPPSRSSTLNGDGTPDEGSSSSDIEPSWTVDPKLRDIRDGTSVNMEGDEELERPESPISLKPKRRSPHTSTHSSNHLPTLKTTSPTSPTRSYSFYGSKQPSSSPLPSSGEAGQKVLAERNGNTNNVLPRWRTHLNLNLNSNSNSHPHPSSYPAQLSPSMPTIRKRERATSHPDIFQLCQSWAESGPANDPVRIDAHGTES